MIIMIQCHIRVGVGEYRVDPCLLPGSRGEGFVRRTWGSVCQYVFVGLSGRVLFVCGSFHCCSVFCFFSGSLFIYLSFFSHLTSYPNLLSPPVTLFNNKHILLYQSNIQQVQFLNSSCRSTTKRPDPRSVDQESGWDGSSSLDLFGSFL